MKLKELKLSSTHPSNAKEFLAWLKQEIESHPQECQDSIQIDYDNMDKFGHPYFSLKLPKQLKPFPDITLKPGGMNYTIPMVAVEEPARIDTFCPMVDGAKLSDGFKLHMDLGQDGPHNGVYSVSVSDWVVKS